MGWLKDAYDTVAEVASEVSESVGEGFTYVIDAVGDEIGEAIDYVGDGITETVDGFVSVDTPEVKEQRKDPAVLKAAEPQKGQRTDGSTIVAARAPQGSAVSPIMGFDQTTLMIGGGILVALLVVSVSVMGRSK